MREKKYVLRILLLSLALFSCAAQKRAKEKVENEIKNEEILNQSNLEQSSRDYILNSKTITDEQKKDLISLQDKTMAESKKINEEMTKAKMILVRTMLTSKVNEREVFILRNKIRKLGKKKVDLDFKSFLEARRIIDPLKELRDREFLYESYMLKRNYYW